MCYYDRILYALRDDCGHGRLGDLHACHAPRRPPDQRIPTCRFWQAFTIGTHYKYDRPVYHSARRVIASDQRRIAATRVVSPLAFKISPEQAISSTTQAGSLRTWLHATCSPTVHGFKIEGDLVAGYDRL